MSGESKDSGRASVLNHQTCDSRFYGRSAMASVGFLGTGMLGGAMVEGMLRRGDAVTVWNRTEAKARALEAFGAKVAATPADAVGIMLVSGPQAVFDEVRGELQKMTGDVWYVGEQADLAAAYKIFGNSMLFVIAAGV